MNASCPSCCCMLCHAIGVLFSPCSSACAARRCCNRASAGCCASSAEEACGFGGCTAVDFCSEAYYARQYALCGKRSCC